LSLLRLISWPYFRRHIVRTVLTITAIALGSAVFVGMHTANQTVLFAFAKTVDRIAGKTELQISAGETGFGEDVLDKVQAASTVRVAVPVIEAVVDSRIRAEGKLLVLGVDMTGDQSLRDYEFDADDATVVDDPLIFLAQPDSLILSNEFGRRNGIAAGDRMRLGTAEGEKVFTVRGLMKSSGLSSAFGGTLAVMDIYAAQKMFGRGRTFDRIELAMKPGVTLAACRRELETLLGPAFTVQPPSSRSHEFETLLAGYSMLANVSSAFALFIGMFIIYNSFAVAVTQRRFEIGVLRALGATRGQIRSVFLSEGAILGLVGAAAGTMLGVAIARAIAASVGRLIADVYGVAQRADDLAVDPLLLSFAVGIGVATSVLAAAIPAGQAASVDPVQALQKGRHQVLSAGENRLRARVGLALALVSVLCLVIGRPSALAYVGYVLTVVVALLLGPMLSLLLAKAIRPALTWLRPVEGSLAADSLIRAPRRTSATVAALMLSLALTVAFSGIALAINDSLLSWMNTTLNPDLFVMPSQSLDVQTTRFPAAMGTEIAALPGVARVQSLRNARIAFRTAPVMAVAIEMSSVAETDSRDPIEGNREEMYRKASQGQGVLVSDTLAQVQGLRLGDVLDIPAPYGQIRLPIVGIVLDYSDQQGAILMDRTLFVEFWHDDSVNVFRVYATDAGGIADLRQRLLELYSGQRQVFVLTNGDVKSYIAKVTGQWFTLTMVQIGLAVVVAILGIVNTLTVSISDRRRELGVLRAVGGVRNQIRRTIWLEALGISVIGLLLGCAFGGINLYYVLQIVRHGIGMRLDYHFPLATVLVLVPTIVASGFVASIWPAETAVRASLMEALAYE
jgi:putative ABC transport system permease protein